jgi:DNA repair photolyase
LLIDDDWGVVDELAIPQGASAPPATQIILEDAKSVITRNDSPDLYFDYFINLYRGCEHGCIYCYARPTHSYLGNSPGLDFETQIIAKRNVAAALRSELASPSYMPQLPNIGSATDSYQPAVRELQLTRQLIEVMRSTQHAFGLITKSSGVERDLDLLAPMRRTIEALAGADIPLGVSVAPQIVFINEDMEQVLEAAWAAGARSAFYTVLRLPWELNPKAFRLPAGIQTGLF